MTSHLIAEVRILTVLLELLFNVFVGHVGGNICWIQLVNFIATQPHNHIIEGDGTRGQKGSSGENAVKVKFWQILYCSYSS